MVDQARDLAAKLLEADPADVVLDTSTGRFHVAGTSAGAAFISEHMIAYGDEGSTPRAGMVSLAPGLGLTNRVIVGSSFFPCHGEPTMRVLRPRYFGCETRVNSGPPSVPHRAAVLAQVRCAEQRAVLVV